MLNLTEQVKGGTFCLSKAGLAEGTNANTIKTAAPNGAGTDFAIKGVLYHKADTDNIAMTALAIQPALYTCLYLVQIDADGTVSMVKGTQILTANVGLVPLEYPILTANCCPIGIIRIATATGYTFTSGTDDLSATGITETYEDVFAVPDAPKVA